MEAPERAELDERRITADARRFGMELFARFPELRRHAAMERRHARDSWTLVVTVPAPSGDPRTELVVWVDGGDDPSVAFGGWHTHENVWGAGLEDRAGRAALLDLIEGILTDRFVACEDVRGVGDATILDSWEDDGLADLLTDRYTPERVRLRSWSGRHDREVSLDDLEREEST